MDTLEHVKCENHKYAKTSTFLRHTPGLDAETCSHPKHCTYKNIPLEVLLCF